MVYTPLGSHHHKYIIRQSACVTIVVCSNLIIDRGRVLLIMSEINDRRWTPFPMAAAEATTYYWLGVMWRQCTPWRGGITIYCIPYAADSRRRWSMVALCSLNSYESQHASNHSDTIRMYFRWYRGMYTYFVPVPYIREYRTACRRVEPGLSVRKGYVLKCDWQTDRLTDN